MMSPYVLKRNYYINMTLVIGLLAAVYGILGWAAYSIADNSPPLVIHSAEPSKPVYKHGEPIEIRWKVKKRRVCEADISRSLIDKDSRVTLLAAPGIPRLPAGSFDYVSRIPFPETLPPGKYIYQASALWKCNVFRTIYQRFGDIEFTVVE